MCNWSDIHGMGNAEYSIYIHIYIWNRECNIGKQGIGNVDRVGQPRQIYS